jgi:hypothetical protein
MSSMILRINSIRSEFVLALVGIVSGLFAIRYYAKKIDAIDGKGK